MSKVVGDHLLCTSDAIMFKHTYAGTTYVVGARIADGTLIEYVTDADTTLNSILTYLNGIGGGKLYVDSESYDCDSQHTMITDLSIIGAGEQATIFNVTANVNFFYIGAGGVNNVTISSLRIVLTNAPSAGNTRAIFFLAGSSWRIENVKVIDATDSAGGTSGGIVIGNYGAAAGTVTDAWVINCVCDGRGTRNFGPSGWYGVNGGWCLHSRFKARDSGVAINAAFKMSMDFHRSECVKVADCIIELGHHNGVFFDGTSSNTFYCEDISFVDCTIRNNGDDAFDSNFDKDITVLGCVFKGNELDCVTFEDGCTNGRVIGCKLDTRKIWISACTWVVIADNQLYRATSGTIGIHILASSYQVTITGNTIRGCITGISIENSARVTARGNIIDVIDYQRTCIYVNNSTRCIFIGNELLGSTSSQIYALQEIGSSDYNIFVWNIFWTLDGDDFYGKFVGANTVVQDNFGERIRDQDGTMTGVAGTRFTYDRESGQVTGINTAAVARVTAAVTYHTRFPTGVIPKVLVTLQDVDAAVRIDTVQVDTVTETGFNYAIYVSTAQGATTCKLNWEARPTHRMYD